MGPRCLLASTSAPQPKNRTHTRPHRLEQFAADHRLTIAATYAENESGAKLARPELFRLWLTAARRRVAHRTSGPALATDGCRLAKLRAEIGAGELHRGTGPSHVPGRCCRPER